MTMSEYIVRNGLAYIIEVEHVGDGSSYPWAKKYREFMEYDTENLKETLGKKPYTIRKRKAHSKRELEDTLSKIQKEVGNSEECDALIIVISGYGDNSLLFCNGGELDFIEKFLDKFKGDQCFKLAGKPKLLIAQTCNKLLYPFEGRTTADSPPGGISPYPEKKEREIPAEADMAYIQCCVPGEAPWRNEKSIEGSMFITSLCKHIANENLNLNQVMMRTRTDIDKELTENRDEIYAETGRQLPLMMNIIQALYDNDVPFFSLVQWNL